jgi:stearoyl-CoA desaturase (delta-9 desaturase)
LVTTHITIASVTIFLHRAQSHRAHGTGHAIPAHFFRFWLWLGTGHGDQGIRGHPPQAPCQGARPTKTRTARRPADIKKLLLEGAELYRAESKNMETMAKYGYGTPDDWIERNLYTRYSAGRAWAS